MRQRIEWIDLVKAVSVLLVVFMHASGTLLDLVGTSTVSMTLQHINQAIEPLRMPIFFLASGMLAASAINRPWSQTTRRTTGMIYLYVLWSVLFIGFKLLFGVTTPEPVTGLLFAMSGFWYLYALALFFVIAKLLRNQPAVVVVALAFLPNMMRPMTQYFFDNTIPGSLATSIAMNLGFFLLGAYFKDVVADLADRATWRSTLLLGGSAVAVSTWWLNTPGTVGQSYLGPSLLWVAFGVSLAVQVTRNGAPAWSRYVGSRTLSIYVMQWPAIFLLFEFWPAWTLQSTAAQVLFPFVVTAAVAVVAMWLQNRDSLWWLFNAPSWALGARKPAVALPEPAVQEVR